MSKLFFKKSKDDSKTALSQICTPPKDIYTKNNRTESIKTVSAPTQIKAVIKQPKKGR